MIKRKKHILYEGKCWQKVISAVLTALIFINSVPNMMQINADNGIPAGNYLGTITNSATNANTYDTEDSDGDVEEVGKYSKKFYDEISDKYQSSYNSEDTALEISTPGQLAAFAKFVNDGTTDESHDFSGKHVKLTDNINLDGKKPTIDFSPPDADGKCNVTIKDTATNVWVPIGTSSTKCFAGTFDGGGYEIRNMVVNQTPSKGDAYAGLFGHVAGGTIQNVSITGEQSTIIASSSYDTKAFSGGIVGYATSSSTISSSNKGNVFASSYYAYSGGIVGRANNESSISDCSNSGSVSGSAFIPKYYCKTAYSGGIVGYATSGSISNCSNSGSISGFSDANTASCGGIAGQAGSNIIISDCSNAGDVSVFGISRANKVHCGGIVGQAFSSSTISNCSNIGTVSSSYCRNSYFGGIVGTAFSSAISDCSNTGDVSASGVNSGSEVHCGGIAGQAVSSSTISNCSNTGNVSSSSPSAFSGGVVGSASGSTLNCCYSASDSISVSADFSSTFKGGVIGQRGAAGTATNCYYDKTLAGDIGAIGVGNATGSDDTENKVQGLTTGEMQGNNARKNMAGFEAQTTDDGKEVWYFSDGNYPKLYIDTILLVNSPPHITTGRYNGKI